jgi:hypothetical protein
MIETTLIKYLNNNLDVEAFAEYPEKAPEQFVLLEKTGSETSYSITSATIAIQSYANSLFDAMKLNEKVKKAMERLWELDCMIRCELNTDYNFTDTSTRKYRYQAVFDITYYEEDV